MKLLIVTTRNTKRRTKTTRSAERFHWRFGVKKHIEDGKATFGTSISIPLIKKIPIKGK